MQEYRSIILTEAELINAIISYCRLRKRTIPRGTVRRVVIEDYSNIMVTMLVMSDDGAECPISFGSTDLAAMVIKFCLDRQVCLPAKGNKWVEIIDNCVSLMIEVSSGSPLAAKTATSAVAALASRPPRERDAQ